MPLQIQTITENDFGAGVDTQSAPNKVGPGFIEDALNADPRPTGEIEKRKGYQGYAGILPVRVDRINSSGSFLELVFDESIDLSRTRSTPLVVYGRSSNSTGGDITTSDTVHYYSSVDVDARRIFDTSNTPVVITAAEHEFLTPYLWVGIGQSMSEVNASNSVMLSSQVAINKVTRDVTITYINNTGSDVAAYVYLADRSNVAGTTYAGDHLGNQGALDVLPASSTSSYTLTGVNHGLSANTLIAKVFIDDGTSYVEFVPDSLEIDKVTGTVSLTLTNGSASGVNFFISLSVAPTANFSTGAVGGQSTNIATVDLAGYSAATHFVFLNCYLDDGITPIKQVIPDSVAIDIVANTLSVAFTNGQLTAAAFDIYWQFVSFTTNRLRVTQSSPATYTDNAPQLTVWGLRHDEIYASYLAREGWVTHLDAYRSQGEQRLVSGLGGNLFAARLATESGVAAAYLLPTLYPIFQATLAADVRLGPAFWDTAELPLRTRGYITGDNGGTNTFTVSTVTYDSGTGWVAVLLAVPNMVIAGTLSTIISTTGISDKLLLSNTSYAVHNDTWDIKQVVAGVNTLTIWVDNPSVTSTDWDILGAGGTAGIFTDRLTLLTTSPFLPDDRITSDLFDSAAENIRSVGSIATVLALDNVDTLLSLPAGLKLVGQRTSTVMPLRTSGGVANISYLTRGDMLAVTGLERQVRVKHINELPDVSVTIAAGNGTEAVVTLGTQTTSSLWVGEDILLRGGVLYNGSYTISDVLTATTFAVTSTETASDTATLLGQTISIDEELEFADTTDNSVMVTVAARWLPIEAPDDSFNLTPSTHPRYFTAEDYTTQPILRSTMVNDSLFLTNGEDVVFKYDGNSLYQSGLFRWQANLFMSVDTSPAGKIVVQTPSIPFAGSSNAVYGPRYELTTADDISLFTVGDVIADDTNAALYHVKYTTTENSKGYVYVEETITGTAPGNITKSVKYRYYVRLNAVDANNNVVASAVTGASDMIVALAVNAAVNIRLIGMPAWNLYDYSRLEAQLYRTKADASTGFYRVATIPLSFNVADGYLDITDTAADSDLIELDPLSVLVPTDPVLATIDAPLRAKYVTSAGNRLVLGNLIDYPTLDVSVTKASAQAFLQVSDFVGLKWLLRRDNTDTGTSTDNATRAVFEWVSTTAAPQAVSAITLPNVTTMRVDHGAPHGLVIGDWVYLFRATAGNFSLKFSGWFQVTSAASNTFDVLLANDGVVPATYADKYLFATVKHDIPVPVGLDYNYGALNGNRPATNFNYTFLAVKRLAEAINAQQRKVDTSIMAYADFTPWVVAAAGNEFSSGQLILRQPKVEATTLEVQVPAYSTAIFDLFVNDVRRAPSGQASARTNQFTSRILVSFNNFPEIFDAPTALLDADSASAIDINSADGQEITAIIPFFGDSAFGAALRSGVVVVFKTNSIYVVDLAAKAAGTSPVQKIESQGKGCTFPFSVTVTREGIMFANDTGVYRLTRDLTVDYVGRKYEGKFKADVDTSLSGAIASGHHDSVDNCYKLSYVPKGATLPGAVAVYNHVREYEQAASGGGTSALGSWTTYDNHAAIGWSNLGFDTFFATAAAGQVYQVRRTGLAPDYRDDASPIAMSILTRGNDFGDGAIRKVVRFVISHFRGYNSAGTTLRVGRDLTVTYEDTDLFHIREYLSSSGIADTGASKINTIKSSLNSSKAVYFQLLYENSSLDERVVLTGVEYRVAGLTDKGLTAAASTNG